jgi:hypothetical protein
MSARQHAWEAHHIALSAADALLLNQPAKSTPRSTGDTTADTKMENP